MSSKAWPYPADIRGYILDLVIYDDRQGAIDHEVYHHVCVIDAEALHSGARSPDGETWCKIKSLDILETAERLGTGAGVVVSVDKLLFVTAIHGDPDLVPVSLDELRELGLILHEGGDERSGVS